MGAASSGELNSRIHQFLSCDVGETETRDVLLNGILLNVTTTEVVFAALSPVQVRKLIKERRGHYFALVEKCVGEAENFVENPDHHEVALTCVRILTRLVPFSFESGFSDTLDAFWALGDNETKSEDGTLEENPLGARLINVMFKLAFVKNFTEYSTDSAEDDVSRPTPGESKPDRVFWFPGVGDNKGEIDGNARIDRNRVEVLKLFLACSSQVLYASPEKLDQFQDPWLCEAARAEGSDAKALFYSLLNGSIGYDPIGMGIPYMGNVMEDPREELASTSLHVLLALLDFGSPPPPQDSLEGTANHPVVDDKKGANPGEPARPSRQGAPEPVPNVFRNLLCSLTSEADFAFLFGGFSRLLNNHHEALSTYLPNSMKQIEFHQELLVLFWKIADGNKAFLKYCSEKRDVKEIVLPCLYFIWSSRALPSTIGMVHMCTFILLLLSGDRSFGVALNARYDEHLPLIEMPTVSGSVADLMILVFHKMIVNSHRRLESLYNCFLTIISNVSPYLKTISLPACIKLLNLFEVFSTPRYLLAEKANHQYLFFLVDILNNIIQYQYDGNCQLIYAIIRRKSMFARVTDLSMKDWTPKPASVPSSSPTDAAAATAAFIPTGEWIKSWKSRLPMGTISKLVYHLVPQVESLCKSSAMAVDENRIIDFLKNTTMVGLLPIPHAIVVRRYQPNKHTNAWFTTYLWGVIFLRNQHAPLFDGTKISLFLINQY